MLEESIAFCGGRETDVPELPAEITLKPYGDPRNVMISR